ncbi:acyltransferase family protein [Paraburkholderia bryophila]|uniref:Peptidoglycan/LPS O-acetylase OafA/YrhL n=1 Tax=Paraburkholderia bryophila TaxID=420952 RepID=A0A7Y9WS73_9BURK|nr:acyltransferase [Paraburkholderia bryophila]NYH25772.1 peptidoglycan/LPS O-acetylase OafA/YrhL [Paraburkholderia bryophila]
MAPSGKPHCDTFDLIRALAAGTVCVSHLRNLMFADYHANAGIGLAAKAFYFVSNYGHTAVIVFFLLSGYFVGGSVLRQSAAGTWSWPRYLTERLSRLWVVLIPALLLTLFWDRMGIALAGGPFYLGTEGTFDQQINVVSHLGQATFACNLVFLQTLACGTYGSNGPLWSLANEFWYYLWFPACFVLLRQRRGIRAFAAAAFAVGTMVAFPSLLSGFGLWLLGVLLVVLEQRFPARSARTGWPWFTLASGAALLAALVCSRLFLLANDWIVGVPCFAFLHCILWENVRLRPALLSRIAIRFSGFSYSLYLTHFSFILFVAAVGVGRRIPFDGHGALVFAGMLVLCYAYAYAVYLLFEQNTRRVQRGLQQLRFLGIRPDSPAPHSPSRGGIG